MEEAVPVIAWIVAFVLVSVSITGLSGRLGWSAPVTLAAVGSVISFIPGVPIIPLEPDLVLYGILPPLLYSTAIRTPLADIRARGDSILLLSGGLVAVTVWAVGFSVWAVIPAVGLAAACALGAIVAPTDAVAVGALTGRTALPRRVSSILETESLLNDAAALVALNTAVAAISTLVGPAAVVSDFVIAVGVGTVVGIVVGQVFALIRRRLNSPVLDTSLSVVIPYAAFLPAQLLGGSGVLAVVAAGLLLGYRSPTHQTSEARIAESMNWRTIQFLLENAVFLLIGLNLATVVDGLSASSVPVHVIIVTAVGLLCVLPAVRYVFILACALAFRFGPRRWRHKSWNHSTVVAVSAAGARGVVTLAAAFLLPANTPELKLLQFFAFVVVAGTLLQGLALPAIIRALKLPPPNAAQERAELDQLLIESRAAGLLRLEQEVSEGDDEGAVTVLRANGELQTSSTVESGAAAYRAYARLRGVMIDSERASILAARAERRVSDRAVREALAIVDAEETAIRRRVPPTPPVVGQLPPPGDPVA